MVCAMSMENDKDMPYIIEEIVMFDEVKGSLLNIETKDEISLPPTASCILFILLDSGNTTVGRHQFIDMVYSNFGFDLSNNTLNQYISLLRKNIRNLGVDSEVIITVPRIGFHISADITVVKNLVFFSDSAGPLKQSRKFKNKLVNMAAIIMAFTIIFEAIYIPMFAYSEPEKYPLEKRGRIGSCDLYLSANLSRVHSMNAVALAAKLAEKYLPCTPGSVFIYDINALNFLNGTGKIYLSRCTGTPGDDAYAVCTEVALNEE